MTKKQEVQFNAEITPEQVEEELKQKEKNLKKKEERMEKLKEATKAVPEVEEAPESKKPQEQEKKPEEKEKKAHEVKPSEFPVDARINDYGFLHFKVGVLKALGWHKGMALKIERNQDGSITLRKT